jgi:RND superfamily putative drug exporter
MTSTFMVFALSPLLVLKMMGLALSVGIIIDATISRIILLPAAMKLAGKWNWYLPKWLKKILPEIKIEH